MRFRIIPAYAGNTRIRRSDSCTPWDHPRVCGEHDGAYLPRRVFRGSSPRMRGTRSATSTRRPETGIIPAYAGNTCHSGVNWPSVRDHPRVCGEHSSSPWMLSEATGSSPRMRGTRRLPQGHASIRGIIPAYAGNTGSGLCQRTLTRDHPRVCGEH